MLPYPYGTTRDSSVCNFDRTDLGKMGEGLYDHRAPADAFPDCVSPFGVHDMVGNVDEWTRRTGQSAPHRSALHGGWWLPGRNNCRAATREHAEDYSGKQVGFRCCTDAARDTAASP
jgi:formylglycine-generating enzyme required for sulfatase activity